MTPLRAQLIRHMQLRRYASTTQEQYVRAVIGFAQFYKRSPEHLTPDEIHTYLHHLLVDRGLAWNTCNVIAAGLRCFYLDVLHWKASTLNLPSRRGVIQLPRVLSAEELERLFEAAANPKHRALLMTTYAAGLRVSEVVRLRLPDIKSQRMLLWVNQGKGFKDRYTLLSPRLLTELRAYWKQYRPDPWLFPSSDRDRPLHRNSALRAYEQARQRANILRGRGIHTLRHSFATHLMEPQAAETYRPPRWEAAEIFRRYGEEYRQSYPVPPAHAKVIAAITSCRTAALGGHAEQCPQCGFARYAYHSCRNRHCPTCQTLTTAQWVEDRKADLLPVPAFHVVFTLPHELNPLVLGNKRRLLTLLFTAAGQTLGQFGHQNLGGQIGGTMVLHTWDQTLNAHFHVHCLVPAGALADDGARWIPTHPRFLFPVPALSLVFRGKFLDALQQLFTAGALYGIGRPSDGGPLIDSQSLLDTLYRKPWMVYVTKPCAGPGQVLAYLSRYVHRIAITNHRLVAIRDGQVCFRYRNRREGNRTQTMTLSACEFIRRFLLHVLLHGFVRLRYIGFLANRWKARALRQCRQLLGQSPVSPPRTKKTMQEWLWLLTGTDITRCPQCGRRPLQRVSLPAVSAARDGALLPPPVWDSS